MATMIYRHVFSLILVLLASTSTSTSMAMAMAEVKFCETEYLQKINFNVLQPAPFEGATVVRSLTTGQTGQDKVIHDLGLSVDFATLVNRPLSALKVKSEPLAGQRGLEGRYLFFTLDTAARSPWKIEQLRDCSGEVHRGAVYTLPWKPLVVGQDFQNLLPSVQRLGIDGSSPTWLIFETRQLRSAHIAKREALFSFKPKQLAFYLPFKDLYRKGDMAAVQSRLPSGEQILVAGPKSFLAKSINGVEQGTFAGSSPLLKSGSIHYSLNYASYQAKDMNNNFGHHVPKTLRLTGRGVDLSGAKLKVFKKGVLIRELTLQGAAQTLDLLGLESAGHRHFASDLDWYQLNVVLEVQGQHYGLFGIHQGFQGTGTAGGLTFPY